MTRVLHAGAEVWGVVGEGAMLPQSSRSPGHLSPGAEAMGWSCFLAHVICISEVIDISPDNLDSSWFFFQPSVSHDVLCVEVK